jgi:hypothetical protein
MDQEFCLLPNDLPSSPIRFVAKLENVGWAERFYREAQQTKNINTVVLNEDWVCWASYLSPTYILWQQTG